jgi:V-type H+-transporting ATPase subunit a
MLQTALERTENEILELSQNAVNLKSNFLELTELKHVLEKTESFFTEHEGITGTDSLTRALISEDSAAQTTQIRGRLGSVQHHIELMDP